MLTELRESIDATVHPHVAAATRLPQTDLSPAARIRRCMRRVEHVVDRIDVKSDATLSGGDVVEDVAHARGRALQTNPDTVLLSQRRQAVEHVQVYGLRADRVDPDRV